MAVELAKNGDYSLTRKIVPGKAVQTESSYSLIFREWWGNNGYSSLVDCWLNKM